jgi:hypothetical protein
MDSLFFPCICLGGRKEKTPPALATEPAPFRFKELRAATKNFRKDRLIGREADIYKGYLKSVKQVRIDGVYLTLCYSVHISIF